MKRTLIAIGLLAITLPSFSLRAAEPTTAPFQTVQVRRDAIVATLPATGARWFVEGESSPKRLSTPGEAFSLPAGGSLRLTERHSSYAVTAQLKPNPGLQVESTFDARSFGGAVTKKSYFIPAQ